MCKGRNLGHPLKKPAPLISRMNVRLYCIWIECTDNQTYLDYYSKLTIITISPTSSRVCLRSFGIIINLCAGSVHLSLINWIIRGNSCFLRADVACAYETHILANMRNANTFQSYLCCLIIK